MVPTEGGVTTLRHLRPRQRVRVILWDGAEVVGVVKSAKNGRVRLRVGHTREVVSYPGGAIRQLIRF